MDDARKAEIRARLDGLSKPLRWCPSLTGAMVRHVARNCDIDCPQHDGNGKSAECPGAFGRYDGEFIAAAPNDVADLLAALEEAERKLAMIENRMRERYLFTPEGMEAHMGGDYVSWLRLIQVFQPKFEVAAEKGGDDA
jgi:hypothetical protein